MAHWAWYWKVKKKHQPRILCSTLTSIDSFKLIKNDNFSGFIVQPLDIKAKLQENGLHIIYGKSNCHSYIIPIEKQTCFSGYKFYFKCPLCTCKFRMLYLTNKSVFLCRKCLNLSYKSQLLRPTRRYDYMNEKVTSFIEKKGGDTLWNKPKNMHTATYNKLKEKQHYYEHMAHQAMNQELRFWYGDKIEPYLDGYFDYIPEKP